MLVAFPPPTICVRVLANLFSFIFLVIEPTGNDKIKNNRGLNFIIRQTNYVCLLFTVFKRGCKLSVYITQEFWIFKNNKNILKYARNEESNWADMKIEASNPLSEYIEILKY